MTRETETTQPRHRKTAQVTFLLASLLWPSLLNAHPPDHSRNQNRKFSTSVTRPLPLPGETDHLCVRTRLDISRIEDEGLEAHCQLSALTSVRNDSLAALDRVETRLVSATADVQPSSPSVCLLQPAPGLILPVCTAHLIGFARVEEDPSYFCVVTETLGTPAQQGGTYTQSLLVDCAIQTPPDEGGYYWD